MQQSRHAFFHRLIPNVDHTSTGLDKVFDTQRTNEKFVNANPSLISEIPAFGASYRFIDFEIVIVFNTQFIKMLFSLSRSEFLIGFFRWMIGFLAIFA